MKNGRKTKSVVFVCLFSVKPTFTCLFIYLFINDFDKFSSP